MNQEEPKIQIDSDWKAEAQAEKERLAKQAEATEAQPGKRGAGEVPPADFQTLIGTLASQAVMGLGAVRDPKTGGVVVDLPGARFAIDLLAVVEEKTKGNLSKQESVDLAQALSELRTRFVQISEAVAGQAGAAPAGAAPADAAVIDPTKS
jgi:hypothetical protein